LHRPLGQIEGIVRARRPRRLPAVPTRQEIRAVLNELDGTPRLVCSLDEVRLKHEKDLAGGLGRAPLPDSRRR
jgi:hypothetical protein